MLYSIGQGEIERPESPIMTVAVIFCTSSLKTIARYAKPFSFLPLGSVSVENFKGNISTEP